MKRALELGEWRLRASHEPQLGGHFSNAIVAHPPGHCCIWSTGGMPKSLLTKASDRQSKLVERGGNLKACWLLNRELVVAAPKVLHQGMPGQHDRGTAVLFEPAHRPEPRLQPPVVAFDAVVGVLVGPMPRRRQQVIEHWRIRRCPVGYDLDRRDPRRADRPLKEPAGSRRVPPWRDEYVDDLAELVDRAIDVAPLPSHLHIRLVDLPAVTDSVPA